MKKDITKITLDTMMGIREGVGQARILEFNNYIAKLIEAKEKGLNVDLIQSPMLMDRVSQGIEAGLSATSKGGIEGGIEWQMVSLKGHYSKESQEAIKVRVAMDFASAGAPDMSGLKTLSVDELKTLMEVVD